MTDEKKPTDSYLGIKKDSDSYDRISKWQKASVDITNLKFKLGNILDDFTPEEMQSKKYDDLLETVNVLFEHILGHHRVNDSTQENKNRSVFTYKTGVIAVAAAVSYKLIENLIIFLLTL